MGEELRFYISKEMKQASLLCFSLDTLKFDWFQMKHAVYFQSINLYIFLISCKIVDDK